MNEYHIILCHKEIEKDYFGDYSNRKYISDTGVKGTIDISNGKYTSKVLGEYVAWEWICNNFGDEDRVTLHHYRRKIPISISPIIIPIPILFKISLKEQMRYFHSEKLSIAMENTLNMEEKEIYNKNDLICWNIFKAPISICKEWLKYCGEKLNLLSQELKCGFDIDSVRRYVEDSNNGFLEEIPLKNKDIEYQMRFYACALERYNTIFWNTHNYIKEERIVRTFNTEMEIKYE